MTSLLGKIRDTLGLDAERQRREQRILALFGLAAAVLVLLVIAFGPWVVVGAAVAFAVVAVAVTRPNLIILALAVYTPFEPFLLKFVPGDLYVLARYFSEALIYALVLSAVIRLVMKRVRLQPTPIDVPFVFFIIVALTSLALNAVPLTSGLLGLRQIIRFILLFFAVVHLQPKREFIVALTKIMLAVMVFQGVLGVTQSFVGAPLDEFLLPSEQKFYESIQLTSGTEQTWSPGTRVFATLGRYDQLGTFLCFFLLLAVGLAYRTRDADERKRLLLMVGLAVPALVLTLSRASWFGFALGLFAVGAVLMRDRRVKIGYALAIALALLYLGYSSITVRYLTDYPEQTAAERFLEVFSYERWRGEYYGLGRLYWMVQTVRTVVPSAPIFGVGPGQYGGGAAAALGNVRAYQELNLPFGVYGTEGYIDNNWFSLWGETGTLGLVFYVWMMLALAAVALKTFRLSADRFASGLALGLLGCLLAVWFQAMLGTYLEIRTLALYLWLFAAFVYVLGRKEGAIRV